MKVYLLLLTTVISLNATAGVIQNGNFQTCDYSGWQKDTDGFGDFSTGGDFYIDGSSPDCRAAIGVDHFAVIGDPLSDFVDEAWYGNTLYQELDFTADAGSTFILTIDFEVDSESDSSVSGFLADYFLFGLNDGLGNYYDENHVQGFLIEQTGIDGNFSDSLVFEIDTSFVNESGWYLDFQLNINWDDQTLLSDGFGSTLFIDNVSLTEVKAPISSVPEPSTLSALMLGLIGLIVRKKSFKRIYHNENI